MIQMRRHGYSTGKKVRIPEIISSAIRSMKSRPLDQWNHILIFQQIMSVLKFSFPLKNRATPLKSRHILKDGYYITLRLDIAISSQPGRRKREHSKLTFDRYTTCKVNKPTKDTQKIWVEPEWSLPSRKGKHIPPWVSSEKSSSSNIPLVGDVLQ